MMGAIAKVLPYWLTGNKDKELTQELISKSKEKLDSIEHQRDKLAELAEIYLEQLKKIEELGKSDSEKSTKKK